MALDKNLTTDMKTALGMLKDITPTLEKYAGQSPAVEAVASPEVPTGFQAYEDMMNLRQELIRQPEANLDRMIGYQLVKGAAEGQGVPLNRWLAGDRAALAVLEKNEFVKRSLDTAVGAALIRQDLEPLLYASFVRRFPLWDRLRKEPSNGLVHAYNRVEAAPDAEFISELGTVPSGNGTYTRATANVAIAAIKVGVSVKMQLAALNGGGGWNPETNEIAGGLVGLRRTLQRTIFSGNASVPAGTATTEEGAYDINSFDGLRGTIPAANKRTHDSSTYSLAQDFNLTDSVLSTYGGMASILVMDSRDKTKWMNELEASERIILPQTSIVPGLPTVTGVNLGNSGEVPILGIPGNELGHYTSGGVDVRDAYFLDESTMSVIFLGSEMPTILDIPTGVDGTLSHVFILFQMAGLACKIPNYLSALRIPTA